MTQEPAQAPEADREAAAKTRSSGLADRERTQPAVDPERPGGGRRVSLGRIRSSTASEQALRAGLLLVKVGPAVALVAAVVTMIFLSPLFLSERNLTNLGLQSAAVIALALGQLLVILTGGIDISVGSIIGLVSAASALLFEKGWSGGTILVFVLLVGCAAGMVNGLLYVKGRLPHPLIATLATFGIFRGVAFLFTEGNILGGQPPLVETLGAGLIGQIPVPSLVVAGLAVFTWVLLRRLKWGRWIYAIGGNPEAARRTGIPVSSVLISVYVFCGFAAAIAGVIVAGRTGVGDANAGSLAMFEAITAVLIGGVALLGGRGSVSNALIGALTVTVIQNGLNLLGVTAFWELIAVGTMLIIAVELNVVREALEGRFRVMRSAAGQAA